MPSHVIGVVHLTHDQHGDVLSQYVDDLALYAGLTAEVHAITYRVGIAHNLRRLGRGCRGGGRRCRFIVPLADIVFRFLGIDVAQHAVRHIALLIGQGRAPAPHAAGSAVRRLGSYVNEGLCRQGGNDAGIRRADFRAERHRAGGHCVAGVGRLGHHRGFRDHRILGVGEHHRILIRSAGSIYRHKLRTAVRGVALNGSCVNIGLHAGGAGGTGFTQQGALRTDVLHRYANLARYSRGGLRRCIRNHRCRGRCRNFGSSSGFFGNHRLTGHRRLALFRLVLLAFRLGHHGQVRTHDVAAGAVVNDAGPVFPCVRNLFLHHPYLGALAQGGQDGLAAGRRRFGAELDLPIIHRAETVDGFTHGNGGFNDFLFIDEGHALPICHALCTDRDRHRIRLIGLVACRHMIRLRSNNGGLACLQRHRLGRSNFLAGCILIIHHHRGRCHRGRGISHNRSSTVVEHHFCRIRHTAGHIHRGVGFTDNAVAISQVGRGSGNIVGAFRQYIAGLGRSHVMHVAFIHIADGDTNLRYRDFGHGHFRFGNNRRIGEHQHRRLCHAGFGYGQGLGLRISRVSIQDRSFHRHALAGHASHLGGVDHQAAIRHALHIHRDGFRNGHRSFCRRVGKDHRILIRVAGSIHGYILLISIGIVAVKACRRNNGGLPHRRHHAGAAQVAAVSRVVDHDDFRFSRGRGRRLYRRVDEDDRIHGGIAGSIHIHVLLIGLRRIAVKIRSIHGVVGIGVQGCRGFTQIGTVRALINHLHVHRGRSWHRRFRRNFRGNLGGDFSRHFGGCFRRHNNRSALGGYIQGVHIRHRHAVRLIGHDGNRLGNIHIRPGIHGRNDRAICRVEHIIRMVGMIHVQRQAAEHIRGGHRSPEGLIRTLHRRGRNGHIISAQIRPTQGHHQCRPVLLCHDRHSKAAQQHHDAKEQGQHPLFPLGSIFHRCIPPCSASNDSPSLLYRQPSPLSIRTPGAVHLFAPCRNPSFTVECEERNFLTECEAFTHARFRTA